MRVFLTSKPRKRMYYDNARLGGNGNNLKNPRAYGLSRRIRDWIQGWKMYRTTGPMVPENFWVYQKIFRSKKELLARHKDKFLIGRKYIELENEKN